VETVSFILTRFQLMPFAPMVAIAPARFVPSPIGRVNDVLLQFCHDIARRDRKGGRYGNPDV